MIILVMIMNMVFLLANLHIDMASGDDNFRIFLGNQQLNMEQQQNKTVNLQTSYYDQNDGLTGGTVPGQSLSVIDQIINAAKFLGYALSVLVTAILTIFLPPNTGEHLSVMEQFVRIMINFIIITVNFVVGLEVYKVIINRKPF